MSKTTDVWEELLEKSLNASSDRSVHLLGQVTAEVINGDTTLLELERLVANAQVKQLSAADTPVGEPPHPMRHTYSLLVGLLQTLVVDRDESQDHGKGQGTVMERALYVLAQGPATPSTVAKKAGCAQAVASRTLRRLRDEKLAERVTTDPANDGRFHEHQLTPDGEAWVNRRFLGDTASFTDAREPDAFHAPQFNAEVQLSNLLRTARRINKYDPSSAASLAPIIEQLAGTVTNTEIRADALGELCVLARSAKDKFSPEDTRRWYESLLDLTDVSPAVTARAYYERGRWRMLYEAPAGNPDGALIDFDRARRAARNIDGEERLYRTGWCSYQEALIALHRGDGATATTRATDAKYDFESLTDERFDAMQAAFACDILTARADHLVGRRSAAKRKLEAVLLVAERLNYKRQIADARRWLGHLEAQDGDSDAETILAAAADSYQQLAENDIAAEMRATKSSFAYLNSDMSDAYATVFKNDLIRYCDQLRTDRSPAYYWRKATLSRRLAIVIAQSDSASDEARQAFISALHDYAMSRDFKGQSEVLAWWWIFVRPNEGATKAGLQSLIRSNGVELLADDIIDSAILVCRRVTVYSGDAADGTDTYKALLRQALLG